MRILNNEQHTNPLIVVTVACHLPLYMHVQCFPVWGNIWNGIFIQMEHMAICQRNLTLFTKLFPQLGKKD